MKVNKGMEYQRGVSRKLYIHGEYDMRRKGFTLIELLVVIGIIAILAAILFPVFASAREKAKQSSCLNNMGQLTKAFKMYLDDYSGRYPLSGCADWTRDGTPNPFPHGPRVNGPGGSWIWFDGKYASSGSFYYNNPSPPWTWKVNPSLGSMWGYTNKSRKIYVCPSDKHSMQSNWTRFGGFGLSYTLNSSLLDIGNTKDTPGAVPAFESEIIRPAKTVLLADSGDGSWSNQREFTGANGGNPVRTPCFDGNFRWWQEAPTPVHVGGQNWSFCDGHVKWLSLKQWRTLVFYRNGRLPDPSDFTNTLIQGD
jgi:prepilin-type N-terminal cleavage/methylation domain-containing protein/prepilin-type processing-associated H-X9-DG protein